MKQECGAQQNSRSVNYNLREWELGHVLPKVITFFAFPFFSIKENSSGIHLFVRLEFSVLIFH